METLKRLIPAFHYSPLFTLYSSLFTKREVADGDA